MPLEPDFDIAALDLSRVLVDARGLDRYLRQAGRFRMLDGILHEDPGAGLVVGYKEVRGSDWWAPDHVPGRPMFPGALQVEAAAQLASYDYVAHRLQGELPADKFVGFGGVDHARFRRAVLPDCRLVLCSRLLKSSRRMFRYATQGFIGNERVFDAEILGVIV